MNVEAIKMRLNLFCYFYKIGLCKIYASFQVKTSIVYLIYIHVSVYLYLPVLLIKQVIYFVSNCIMYLDWFVQNKECALINLSLFIVKIIILYSFIEIYKQYIDLYLFAIMNAYLSCTRGDRKVRGKASSFRQIAW